MRCAIQQNSVRTAQHLMAASWMTPEEFSETLVVAMNTNPDFANRLIMEDRSLSPANIVSHPEIYSFLLFFLC